MQGCTPFQMYFKILLGTEQSNFCIYFEGSILFSKKMAVHTVFGDIIKILERLSYTNSVAFVSHSSPVGGGTTLLSWPNVLR